MSDGDMYISVSPLRQIIIAFMDDDFNSDLYSSAFDGAAWEPAKNEQKQNTRYWESHGFFSR
jgi:hypothetical protein